MDYIKQFLEQNIEELQNNLNEMGFREKELKMELMNVQQRLIIGEEMLKQLKAELKGRE